MAQGDAFDFPMGADPKPVLDALKSIEEYSKKTSESMSHHYEELGRIVRRVVGWTGAYSALEKGVDLAAEQIKLQKVQAQIITNNGLKQAAFVGKLVGWTKQTKDGIQTSDRWYSSALDAQANKLSLLTGLSKNQFVHAQNLLIPNQDLAKLLSANKGTMEQALLAAANMSDVMGGGGEGSVVGSARILSRVLTDPAKRMSAMVRTGVSLSKVEQQRIKAVEATSGLLAAQQLLLVDINKHIGGVAQVSRSPIERLKNDMNLLKQSLGVGLIPILENFARALEPLVTALQGPFEQMAEAISKVSESLGTSLGEVLGSFTPMLKFFVQNLLPSLLAVADAFLKLAVAIIKPLGDALTKIVDSGAGAMFDEMAAAVSDALLPAIISLSDAFTKMFSDPKNQQAFVDMFKALMPILPSLAKALSDIIIAITPGIIFILPYLMKFVTFMAQIWAWSAKVLAQVVHLGAGFMNFANQFGIGKVAVGGFFAFFLGKLLLAKSSIFKLLVLPLTSALKLFGIGGGGKGIAGAAEKGLAGSLEKTAGKGLLSKVLGGAGGAVSMTLGAPLITKALSKIPGIGGLLSKGAGLLGKGAGALSGGLSTTGGSALQNNTNALINLTNVLKAGGGGSRFGGGMPTGGGINDLPGVKKIEDKLLSRFGGGRMGKLLDRVSGSKVGGMLEKFTGGRFGNMLEKTGVGKIAKFGKAGAGLLERFGGSKIGGLLGKVGGKQAAGFLGKIGGGALMEGLGLGALEGAGALIPGIGWGLTAGMLAFQYRKQIGGALKGVGHALGIHGRQTGPEGITKKMKNGNISYRGTPVFHSGGLVPGMAGQDVPAILQAGEAVLSARTVRNMNRGGGMGGGFAIHPNAVNITINGNADAQTVALIKHHVDAQFKEFHHALKSMGR